MECSVRRDTRRFVFFRWRLLEIPVGVPLDPVRVFRTRYNLLPPLGMGALTGIHFRVEGGARAVKILRPDTPQVPDPIRNRLFSVLREKHRVPEVRLALSGEIPTLKTAYRLPTARDHDRVEEWPDDGQCRDLVLAELALSGGFYLSGSVGWDSTTSSLDAAALFTNVEEAESFVSSLTPTPAVIFRWKSACVAEWDQREAAAIEGKRIFQ